MKYFLHEIMINDKPYCKVVYTTDRDGHELYVNQPEGKKDHLKVVLLREITQKESKEYHTIVTN